MTRTFSRKTFTSLTLFATSMTLAGIVYAGDGDGAASRHTFRGIRSGTAAQLEQTRIDPQDVQVIRAQPLRGDGTATARATSSSGSTATSDLLGASRVASAPMRAAVASPAPSLATVTAARQATPLVVAAAPDDVQPVIDDRAAVDNNARLAGNGTGGYQTTTVSHDDAQLALGGTREQNVSDGNTYGTYSPVAYQGYASQSYAPRTSYRPASYYGYTTVAYSSPVYYTSGYCAPTYYRPSYSYCGPTYYRPSYGYGYGYGYNYYSRPSYSFGYSYGSRCGSNWGFSVRW